MKNKRTVKNFLEMVPGRNYRSEAHDDGTADVIIPRYGKSFVGRILSAFLKNTPIRIHLDKVGTRTWELCDGSRPVLEIGKCLQREFGSEIDPVFDRLELFFRQMENQRLICWKAGESSQGS
jgi:hypothetical protein